MHPFVNVSKNERRVFLLSDKLPNRSVSDIRIRRKIMVSFARQYDEFGIGNLPSKLMGGVPVSFIRGAVFFVVANEHERGDADLLQAIRVVMFLAREHKGKIVFQRSDAGHPDLEKFFDQIGMGRNEFFGPTRFDGVLTNVTLEAHANHVAAHGKRYALRSWMRRV